MSPSLRLPGAGTRNRREAPFHRVKKTETHRWTDKILLTDSLNLLDREVRELGCRHLVIEADFREEDIKLDGWPRASARPRSPRVVVSLLNSVHGPLRYPCDTFTRFEDNVRAIGLALEALRKVDRYGVTRKGEQYAGWKQLPSSTEQPPTPEEAAKIVVAEAGDEWAGVSADVLGLAGYAKDTVREAIRRTHPDSGGNAAAFHRVMQARKVLSAYHKVPV